MIAEESRKSAEAPTAQLGRTAELGDLLGVGEKDTRVTVLLPAVVAD